jgi:hypothetical protein
MENLNIFNLTNEMQQRNLARAILIRLAVAGLIFVNGISLASCKDDVAKQTLANKPQPSPTEDQTPIEPTPAQQQEIAEEPKLEEPAAETEQAKPTEIGEVDYSQLPTASEAQPGERCYPDNFPYYSFVMPEGYKAVPHEHTDDQKALGSKSMGSLRYNYPSEYTKDALDEVCCSGFYLDKIDSDGARHNLRIDYVFYGNTNFDAGSEGGGLPTSEILASKYNKDRLDDDTQFLSKEYGKDSFKLEENSRLNSTVLEKFPAAVSFHEEYPDIDIVSVCMISPNNEVPGYIEIMSNVDDDSFVVVKTLIESMSAPTLTEADARRITKEMQEL